jgi:hypothetical protein
MLRVWLRQGGLFQSGIPTWGVILAGTAIVDCVSGGKAQVALEAEGFAAGVGFALLACGHDARLATPYFASLPLDPRRSRACVIDAGMLWLVLLIVGALAFQYAGPAELIVRGFRAWVTFSSGDGGIGSAVPALDRLSLPLLGYWLTTVIQLELGFCSGIRKQVLHFGVLLPVICLALLAIFYRHVLLHAAGGWLHWPHYVGSGLFTLIATWWLARGSRMRIACSGTELVAKGVLL